MKKAKSTRPKSSSSANTTSSPNTPSCSADTSQGDTFSVEHSASEQLSGPQTSHKKPQAPLGAQGRPSKYSEHVEDIPEDAMPPERPDPFLNLQLSAALHSRLRHQAQDEGISVEALALEMLAESVVLRAWEIVERKSAMRGLGSGQGGGQPQGSYNRGGYNNSPQANGNTKHPRSQYGASSGQNHHQSQHGNSNRAQGYNGGHGRHQNNAWMEDKAAFLEYVRNQEKRGRR